MPTLRSRRGALALVMGAVLMSLAILSGVSADSPSGALHVSDQMETIAVPPAVLAVMDTHTARGAHEPAAPAQAPELITLETFEEEAWPPQDWEVVTLNSDGEADETYTWGRVTCEAYESDASAWSIGGGTEGVNKTCWTPYDNYMKSYLMYPGIDTTAYQGGLQVQLRLKRNIPTDDAFKVCTRKAGEETADCFSTQIGDDPGQETPWLQLNDPWLFEGTGGLVDLTFFVLYEDEAPDGTKKGVLVDDIMLEGVTQQEPPTAEPTAGPGGAVNIYLPLTFKSADLGDLEPIKTPEPSSVDGAFGIGLDSTTGDLLGEGVAFEYGQMLLCFKMSWTDIEIGTPMRYLWHADDTPILPDSTDLNPVFSADAPTGWAGNCIQANNPDTGDRIPIPLATYRVDMWVENITPDDAPVDSASAVVQEDTPDGATALPTPEPTLDPGEFECNDILINGDFEQGPNVGWTLRSNVVDQDQNPISIDQVILEDPDAAIQGDWFAYLGRCTGCIWNLLQSEPLPMYAAGSVEKATLTFQAGLVTEEIPDGEHNDIFAPFFASQASDPDSVLADILEVVPNSGMTEENVEHGQWLPMSFDVTDMLIEREGWETFQLMYISEQNEQLITQNFLDNSTLEVCTRISGPAPAANDVTRLQGTVRPFAPILSMPMNDGFQASDAFAPVSSATDVGFSPAR